MEHVWYLQILWFVWFTCKTYSWNEYFFPTLTFRDNFLFLINWFQFRHVFTTCHTLVHWKCYKVPQWKWNVEHPVIRCQQLPGQGKTMYFQVANGPCPVCRWLYSMPIDIPPDNINVLLIMGSDSRTPDILH